MRALIISDSILSRGLGKEEVRREESKVGTDLPDQRGVCREYHFFMDLVGFLRVHNLNAEFSARHEIFRRVHIVTGIGLVDETTTCCLRIALDDLASRHDGLNQLAVTIKPKI